MTEKIYNALLKEARHEGGDLWTFVFTTDEPIPYAPGQYAHWRLNNLDEGRVREFSFSSMPGDDHVSFTTHIRPESLYKQALSKMNPGDGVEIFKVKGDLVLADHHTHPVFIAQGVGVTPFRSIIRDIHAQNRPVTPTLVHVAREHLFRDEFASLPFAQHRIGREDIESALESATQNKEATYFLVGMPDFIQSLTEKLREKGVTEEHITTDDWAY